jgi:cell wall-associated NlpC family hydrolase
MKLKIRTYQIGLLACAIFTSSTTFAKNPQNHNENQSLQRAYHQLVKKPQKRYSRKYNRASRQANISRYRAAQVAKQQLRKRYRWGGKSPRTGFDCSGLTQYAYQKANISIPRTTSEQYKNTQRIRMADLRVGDLIFFKTRRTRQRVNHVGIYMGGGNFIHAPRRGKNVTVGKLNKYWRRKVVGAGRI